MGANTITAQDVMTPETLWQLGNTSFLSLTPDNKQMLYKVTHINISNEKKNTKYFLQDIFSNLREITFYFFNSLLKYTKYLFNDSIFFHKYILYLI